MSRPLLVVIGYVWPEPKSSAAGSRMLHLINIFRDYDWQIIFASSAALSEHRFDLTSIGVEERSIALNDSSFDRWIQSVDPTAVLFDRFFTEEQFGWRVQQNCPNAIRILDTEDFHGLRKIRQRLLKNQLDEIDANLKSGKSQSLGVVASTPAELFQHMVNDEAVQREIAAIFRCDLNVMVSEFEIELLTHFFNVPLPILFYLPLIVDLPTQAVALRGFSERKDFIVIGNFRHEPNWDSVQLLKNWIWPELRKKLCELGMQANLLVYGAYPPPKATQLHNASEGFLVKGWVEDAQTAMGEARVCLAPLRFGAGQKGKLLLAMQMGTPSLTTSIGAEAMYESKSAKQGRMNHWCGSIADDLETFVNQAALLYTSESDWHKSQQTCVRFLEERLTTTELNRLFWKRFGEIQVDLQRHRYSNPVGIMLLQQQFRATQYMGQWIEEKNKKAH